MIIKYIDFYNFRQYIGEQRIDFSCDKEKNVTVLIGINTSGKTTLIRGFEWCLYNEINFDDKILLNRNVADAMNIGDIQQVWVQICFEHNDVNYELKRLHKYTCTGKNSEGESIVKKIDEDVCLSYLQSDGQTRSKIETYDIKKSIDRVLPEDLASYFFFGGERISNIGNREDLADAVKGLMGLDVLDNARTHLAKVIKDFKATRVVSGDTKAQQAKDGKTTCENKLRIKKQELEDTKKSIAYYEEKKEAKALELRESGAEETAKKQRRREQLDYIISSDKNGIAQDQQLLVELFNHNSFAYFGMPLIKRTLELLQDKNATTDAVPYMHQKSIKYLIKRGYCLCGTRIDSGSAAEQHLLDEMRLQPPESIGSLVKTYKNTSDTFLAGADGYYESIVRKSKEIYNKQIDLAKKIDERDTISKEIAGSKDTKKIEDEYQEAAKKVRDLRSDEADLQREIGSLEKDIRDYEAALDAYAKADKKNAVVNLQIEYAEEVYYWVDEAYKEREGKVRGNLETKVNSNFELMYHGKRSIKIDEKYRVNYGDIKTEESDGLKAVKSFAFVAGLVEMAKEELSSDDELISTVQEYPLVMDAPFSNTDEIHIENICKILPTTARQVVIAVMKKDWEQAEKKMNAYVGKKYLINKDKDSEGNEIDTMTHISSVEV